MLGCSSVHILSSIFRQIVIFSYLFSSFLCRSIGVGVFSLTSRIGSVVAPLLLLLTDVWLGLPYIVMGLASTIASLLCLLLPETKGKPLPTTVQDTEGLYRFV